MNLSAIFKPSLRVFPSLTGNLSRNIVSWTKQAGQWNATARNSLLSQFCGMSKPMNNMNISLMPDSVNVIPSCGMKMKGKLKLRCPDCYFYTRDGILYVYCGTHPRHMQMSRRVKAKATWLLSHACMSKQRPY